MTNETPKNIKKILFVSHEASITGAPIELIHFLRWFKVNSDIPFEIICIRKGPLVSEFKKIAKTIVIEIDTNSHIFLIGITKKILNKLNILWYKLFLIYRLKSKINLIYSNTIVNGRWYSLFSYFNCPIITHVHELETVIKNSGRKNLEAVIKYTDHFIAASNMVKENLIRNHLIKEKNITVIYEGIDLEMTQHSAKTKSDILNEIGIKENSFIVGGAGTVDLRKGADIFISIANNIIKDNPKKNIYFVWIGALLKSKESKNIINTLLKTETKDKIKFIGLKNNPTDYFSIFDVFLMPSREDPFPLVCLENAYVKNPIICFENAGGMPEFVENDSGYVIPYLDQKKMSEKIIYLYENRQEVIRLGRNASEKVTNKFSIGIIAPKLYNIILNYYDK